MPYLSLIIERDSSLAEAIQQTFPAFALKPCLVDSREAALDLMRQWRFDAVVLDARAVGPACLQTLQTLRARSRTPLLLLAGTHDEQAQIASLESGATEIVVMPASARLIAAKLRRLIEAGAHEPQDDVSEISVGPLAMDARRARVTIDGVPLDLTTQQFELLFVLAARAGRFVRRETLARLLRGPITEIGRSADMHIYRIRKKLRDRGIDSLRLDTIYGRGYCLSVSDEALPPEEPVRDPEWSA